MAAIYSVYTSPQHAPIPGHLPTLIVTPHGQPNQILYTYLHTEENKVNYLLTPSPQGDLCVAKLYPPNQRTGQANGSSSSVPSLHKNKSPNVVRCEASRDLRWTIENTGVVSPIYKIVNQDDTPLYQISKPNPNADFWTMFYFKYAGHQIPPRRIEFGKISKNPPEKGGGTKISVTGKTDDEKQVWQTLGVGNEDCVEWVVSCAVLNLLDDEILRHAEKKQQTPNPNAPAATAPAPFPASTLRPSPAASQRPIGGPAPRSGMGPGIASSAPAPAAPAATNGNLSAAYRGMRGAPAPPMQQQQQQNARNYPSQQQMRPPPQNGHPGYDPRSMRGPPPGQQPPQQQQARNGYPSRAPPTAAAGRRF